MPIRGFLFSLQCWGRSKRESVCLCVCVCVCVCAKESVFTEVLVYERTKDIERMWVCACVRGRRSSITKINDIFWKAFLFATDKWNKKLMLCSVASWRIFSKKTLREICDRIQELIPNLVFLHFPIFSVNLECL